MKLPLSIKDSLALLISAIGVHLLYVLVVRPNAALAVFAAEQSGRAVQRTFFVIIKDYEQEICFILFLWGMYLILQKCLALTKDRYLFKTKLIDEPDARADTTLEMRAALREFEQIEDDDTRNSPLIKTLSSAARRYIATRDIQNTSDAIVTGVDALAARLEAENSMIRYLIWVIPSIGFIGTVRGIGAALSQADAALAGDISGMTDSLGVAFNSTLVALIISIVLMFFLHELQRLQDKLVTDTQAYCEEFLLHRIEKN